MNFFACTLIAFFAMNALVTVARIGKSGPVMTPGGAVVSLVIYAVLIMFVVWAVAS